MDLRTTLWSWERVPGQMGGQAARQVSQNLVNAHNPDFNITFDKMFSNTLLHHLVFPRSTDDFCN